MMKRMLGMVLMALTLLGGGLIATPAAQAAAKPSAATCSVTKQLAQSNWQLPLSSSAQEFGTVTLYAKFDTNNLYCGPAWATASLTVLTADLGGVTSTVQAQLYYENTKDDFQTTSSGPHTVTPGHSYTGTSPSEHTPCAEGRGKYVIGGVSHTFITSEVCPQQ